MKPLGIRHAGSELTLIPASCIHYPLGEMSLLRAWVERVRKDPLARTILMGDMIDQDRTHRRMHRKRYESDRTSILTHDDRQNRRDVEELAKILRPIREKVWGVLQGNHFYEYSTGVTSDQYLCELLEIPYCGPLGVFRVTMKNGGATKNLVIWSHHSGGKGGGTTLGSSVNRLLRKESDWDADIYLLGHDHRRLPFRESVMTLTGKGQPRVVERTRIFARVGAFLKTYLHETCIPTGKPHFPGYGEDSAYRASDLGWVEIKIMLKKGEPGLRFGYDILTPDC